MCKITFFFFATRILGFHLMRAPSHVSVKTKVQQRALAGEQYRSPGETLYRLIRGESQSIISI